MLDNAGVYIGKMTASQKLLLASLAVIAAMTMFLVSQYASKPALVDLIGETGDAMTMSSLRSAGIEAQLVDGKIQVPPGQRSSAVAVLAQSGQLPGDTTLMFQNLIQSQDWKASKEQHRQQFTIALQNELSRTISQFRNVNKASVILDIPVSSGLGRAVKTPSASITMFSSGGVVGQDTVDAAAGLVMGAVSGLNAKAIQVIDGSTGQPRTVSSADSRLSSKYMDQAQAIKESKEQQLQHMLGHIPGVIISVTAMVDVKRVDSVERSYAKVDNGTVSAVKTQESAEDTMQQAVRGAEPGVRSNQTASINTGSGAGNSSNSAETVKEYENQFGYIEKQTIDHRGMPTHLRASIIVPDEYIRELLEGSRSTEEDGAEPEPVTAEDIREWFEGMDGNSGFKAQIVKQVTPHLLGQNPDGSMLMGEVVVSKMPIGEAYKRLGAVQSAGFMGGMLGSSGGGGSLLLGNGNLVETVLVGVLAAVSVVLMFTMVKRSSKDIELPTAEELVGLPPQLEGTSDLIGEADEGDSALAGIEVDDAIIQIQQLRDQVSELIAADPEGVAGMVERWAEVDE
ncbi:MAG: flagellar M-ring protein FliF C-terminal domain-containing protein [Phycisphaerales bacterium]